VGDRDLHTPCALQLSGVRINNFFRDWGHQFIYDEQTLRASMLEAGSPESERAS
jgi:hypothetical protein